MSVQSSTFYVTTPIYYVNDAPHIGHSYTTVLADVLNGYHKIMGYDSFFLTGTDEHGQKVQQAAEKKGVPPQVHCDAYAARFKETWKRLDIRYDGFIRTTDPAHKAFVQKILMSLWERKQIYLKEYEGWYSLSEERFFTEKELVNGKDPISGRPVEKIREKNYFFRMSEYQKWLIEHIETHPDFILPDFRRNEVLGFLRQPLNDLCISRPKSRLTWGITLPFDEEYVAYVWVDALFNYMSAVEGRQFPGGGSIWPADYHLIGKDILTTHAVYWPTLLKALEAPLPKHILAHGWWLIDNARMSKTTGNVVDPMQMVEKYGVDAFRYFLIREMAVGQDASFSEGAFIQRVNSDLANDLGNAMSRILKLGVDYLNSMLTPVSPPTDLERDLKDLAEATIESCLEKVRGLKLSFAIEEVLQLVRAVNRYLELKAPWKLAKAGPDEKPALNSILYHAAEALRIAFTLLQPVMPGKTALALGSLGLNPSQSPLSWGPTNASADSIHLSPMAPLFPRIAQELSREKAAASALTPAPAPSDPFAKVHLRVGRVVEVADHPNADTLYKLTVQIGEEIRIICAGLKKHLPSDQLQGKLVAVVYNLKPVNLRGVESQGMVLAVETPSGQVVPVFPENAQSGDAITVPGISIEPKLNLTLKEFEKCTLTVQGGKVIYQGHLLLTESGPVMASGLDGTRVR